jgi:cyclophilin family peptidyl-prolyl cis-trans isomerase
VRDGFYDGIAFHRVKADFMIQAGGYMADLKERTNGLRPPIKNESTNDLKNERGTIAMARVGDPHSATSQFFINVVDNPHLDRGERQPFGYAVFGKVVEGMEVVDKIQRARTIQHPRDPRKGADGAVNPDPPITIREATIVGADAAPAAEPAETPRPRKPARRGARPAATPRAEPAPAEPTPTPAAEPEASPPAGEPEEAPQDPEGAAPEL